MKLHDGRYTVTVGQGEVALRTRGQSAIRTGRILGEEIEDGRRVVYVDRLLLPAGTWDLNDGWQASGCISTILVGPA